MSKNTALVESDATEAALGAVMDVASECALPALRGVSEAQKTLRIARGTMTLLKKMADPQLTSMLKSLAGNELGFGADKKYDDDGLRKAAAIALMKGARLTSFDGPEWMILAGKCYLCKPFYRRMLDELPGISAVVVRTERHEQGDTQTAYVPCVVELRDEGKLRRWEFRKTKDAKTGEEIDRRIGVRVNTGMIVDGILGKAEAKAMKAVYKELSGEELPDADPIEIPRITQEFGEDGKPV